MREIGAGTLSVQLNFSGFLLRQENTSDASVSVQYIVLIGAPVDIAWAALACVLRRISVDICSPKVRHDDGRYRCYCRDAGDYQRDSRLGICGLGRLRSRQAASLVDRAIDLSGPRSLSSSHS